MRVGANAWSVLGILLMLAISLSSKAEGQGKAYISLDGHYLMNNVGNSVIGQAEFNPSLIGARAGVYLQPQVGLEIFGAMGVSDNKDIGIEMSAKSLAGVLARFESPEAENGGKLFLSLGYGMTELEMTRTVSSTPDRELYHGFVYGGGVEFRLGESNTFINLQGLRYYHEDDFSIGGVSLGVRQIF